MGRKSFEKAGGLSPERIRQMDADIAQALGIPERRLKRFNRKHLPAGRPAAGDEVYIDRPRKS